MKKILNTAIILLIVTSILILSSVCFATQTKQSIDLKPISDSRFAVGTGYLGGEIVIAEEIENSKIGMYWKAVAAQSANEDMTFKSSLDKFLTDEIRKELIEKCNLEAGSTLFVDELEVVFE